MARILSLDYGKRRMGVALSDEKERISMPLGVIQIYNQHNALSEISNICANNHVAKIVLGLPINLDGTEGASANCARDFGKKISQALNIPVEFWDERLSTHMVERVLLDSNIRRSKRKQVIDKLAAQAILQSYLDAHAHKRQS